MTYETPEIFELGNVANLTLGCDCGSGVDCSCEYKNDDDSRVEG